MNSKHEKFLPVTNPLQSSIEPVKLTQICDWSIMLSAHVKYTFIHTFSPEVQFIVSEYN